MRFKALKREFNEGRERAEFKNKWQVIIRATFDGFLIASLIWGPYRFWQRLIFCVVARFIYGIIASSKKFHKHL